MFDSALHALALLDDPADRGASEVRLPFAWTDVRLHARAATRLRVRLILTGDSAGLVGLDEAGRLVVSVSELRDAACPGRRAAGCSRAGVRTSAKRSAVHAGGSFAERLAHVPDAQRERVVLELVCAQAAIVLGHASAAAVDAERAFKELGFDSLGGVELRNRLQQQTGLRLPATLIFDRPTPRAVAAFIAARIGGQAAKAGVGPLTSAAATGAGP